MTQTVRETSYDDPDEFDRIGPYVVEDCRCIGCELQPFCIGGNAGVRSESIDMLLDGNNVTVMQRHGFRGALINSVKIIDGKGLTAEYEYSKDKTVGELKKGSVFAKVTSILVRMQRGLFLMSTCEHSGHRIIDGKGVWRVLTD